MITSLIFFPDAVFNETPDDYGFDYLDVTVKTEDGIRLHGWYIQAKGDEKAVLYYLHGNTGNISTRLFKAKGWVERGVSVFMLDYRGYGHSEGKIEHGKDVLTDGRAGLNWLLKVKQIPLGRLIFYGESLGTHPMTLLAVEHKAAAVILEAPYTSFAAMAAIHYPMIPAFMRGPLLKEFEFNNEIHIPDIQSPFFVLHGKLDEVCPYQMGAKLYELAPEPKGMLTAPHGAHNDLPGATGEDFWDKPFSFVMEHLK